MGTFEKECILGASCYVLLILHRALLGGLSLTKLLRKE